MPVLYVIGIILLIGLDQLVKHWVVASLALGQSFSVVDGIYQLHELTIRVQRGVFFPAINLFS